MVQYTQTICHYFLSAFTDLSQKNSFLSHCDVGRDRIGDFIAMLIVILLEGTPFYTPEIIDALECDYEKTPSLSSEKVGHIKNFLIEMKAQNGLKKFIQNRCHIPDEVITKARQNFISK